MPYFKRGCSLHENAQHHIGRLSGLLTNVLQRELLNIFYDVTKRFETQPALSVELAVHARPKRPAPLDQKG